MGCIKTISLSRACVDLCVCCCRFDEFGRRKRSKTEDDKRAREQAALERLYGGTNLAPSELVRIWGGGVLCVGGSPQEGLGLLHAACGWLLLLLLLVWGVQCV